MAHYKTRFYADGLIVNDLNALVVALEDTYINVIKEQDCTITLSGEIEERKIPVKLLRKIKSMITGVL